MGGAGCAVANTACSMRRIAAIRHRITDRRQRDDPKLVISPAQVPL